MVRGESGVMPYFGMVDENGREISGYESYHRKDWSEIRWGVNGRDPSRDASDVDYVIINIDRLEWHAKEGWGKVWLAAFRELEDEISFGGQGPGPFTVAAGDTIVMPPGRLRMPVWGCRWGKRDDEPEPEPDPEKSWWRTLLKS